MEKIQKKIQKNILLMISQGLNPQKLIKNLKMIQYQEIAN